MDATQLSCFTMRISDLQIAIIHDRDIYADRRQIIRGSRFSDAAFLIADGNARLKVFHKR